MTRIKKKNNYKEKAAVFFFALIFSVNAYSQQDLTINTMPIIPQSSYTNPAFQPVPTSYVGFPLLSSFYLGINHSGFAYKDLFHYSNVDDSLHLMVGNMISKLAKTNYLSFNLYEELFGMGFKTDSKGYFNFSYGIKVNFQLSYPRDLIKVLWLGNGPFVGGAPADFSGLGINASLYKELAFGYSRNVKIANEDFTIGGRLKILHGITNIYTKVNNTSWGTGTAEDNFQYILNNTYQVNMTLPNSASESLDSSGSKTYNGSDNKFDPAQFITNQSNLGLGVDLGASYKMNKYWTFGFSVLDLGYINWKTGGGSSVRNVTNNMYGLIFDGADLAQFIGPDSVVKNKETHYEDSLSNPFKDKTTKNSYRTPLGTKFYLTAEYSLTRHDVAGLLFRGEMQNGILHPSATISYNKWVCNLLSASVSYSMENRSYNNVGLGIALNLGAWQIYALSDNFYCLFNPEAVKTINLHFGMNFIFGYKETKPNASLYRDESDLPKASKY
jgi:hypothetical protein